jgi:hypothetical protein
MEQKHPLMNIHSGTANQGRNAPGGGSIRQNQFNARFNPCQQSLFLSLWEPNRWGGLQDWSIGLK